MARYFKTFTNLLWQRFILLSASFSALLCRFISKEHNTTVHNEIPKLAQFIIYWCHGFEFQKHKYVCSTTKANKNLRIVLGNNCVTLIAIVLLMLCNLDIASNRGCRNAEGGHLFCRSQDWRATVETTGSRLGAHPDHIV